MNKKLRFTDKDILKLKPSSVDRDRATIPFDKISGTFLKGVCLRYNALNNSKRFYLVIRIKDKITKIPIGLFIPGVFGVDQCTDKVLEIYRKYYDPQNQLWLYNPNDKVKSRKEIIESQRLTIRQVIIECCKRNFESPKLKKSLAEVTIKQYGRIFFGNHKRWSYVHTDEDNLGGGIIKQTISKDWDTFFKKFPPSKSIDTDINWSLFDDDLGSTLVDNLTKGLVKRFLKSKARTYGSQKNIKNAFSYLWNFSLHVLDCLGDIPPEDPTKNILIKSDEDGPKSKGSIYNDMSYDGDQQKSIETACIRLARSKPFQSEAELLTMCCPLRPTTFLKLRKDDLKVDEDGDPYILVRKEIQKNRSNYKIKNKADYKIPITPPMQRVIARIYRQYLRDERFRFVPWLFPSPKINWERIGEPNYMTSKKTRLKNLTSIRKEIRKLTGLKHTTKVSRKTFITNDVNKNYETLLNQAIEQTAQMTGHTNKGRVIKEHYYKLPWKTQKKRALETPKVISLRKSH